MRSIIKLWKKLAGSACFFAMAGLLGGCASGAAGMGDDPPGVPHAGGDKVTITITCNSQLEHFAAAVEERFPDIRLIQDCYTGQYRISEHIAHIEHQDLGDIIMVKAGHIPKIDMSDQLFDLSTQAFPASFNANALQADEDGHIYLIPGPLSFNCNIYNKTLFEENGWAVPETYEEFLALCQKIDRAGIRGFRNSYFDSTSQSYQIYQYCVFSALDTLTQVDGQIWHNKLMAGEKVSLEPMETAFQDLWRLMNIGAVRVEDLDIPFNVNMDAMANREVAMGGGEIDHIRALNASGDDTFRFMPHFSMTDGQGWLLNLGYFFGANRELQQPGNEKKQKAAMEIMRFIASEEGQALLVEDGLGMMPATLGAEIPEDPVLEQIHTQIVSGHYIMRPTYDMFTPVLETEIEAFIRGETDSASILEKCSRLLEQGTPPPQALGEAAEDFTVFQTGCLKADAMRAATGTDIALVGTSEVNGYDPVGGTRARLYKGIITEDDITRIAQIRMDAPILCARASMTGAELLSLLEYGATSEKEQENGAVSHFHPFAVSGLRLSYRREAEEGKRVLDVRLADGGKLRPDAVYTVSYPEGALPKGEFGGTVTGITMTDAFREYIIKEKRVAPDTRCRAVN